MELGACLHNGGSVIQDEQVGTIQSFSSLTLPRQVKKAQSTLKSTYLIANIRR